MLLIVSCKDIAHTLTPWICTAGGGEGARRRASTEGIDAPCAAFWPVVFPAFLARSKANILGLKDKSIKEKRVGIKPFRA